DDAQRSAEQRALAARQSTAAKRAYGDGAGAGLELVGDESQDRGLAGPAGADEHHTLALIHSPRHVLEHQLLAVSLDDLREVDHGRKVTDRRRRQELRISIWALARRPLIQTCQRSWSLISSTALCSWSRTSSS